MRIDVPGPDPARLGEGAEWIDALDPIIVRLVKKRSTHARELADGLAALAGEMLHTESEGKIDVDKLERRAVRLTAASVMQHLRRLPPEFGELRRFLNEIASGAMDYANSLRPEGPETGVLGMIILDRAVRSSDRIRDELEGNPRPSPSESGRSGTKSRRGRPVQSNLAGDARIHTLWSSPRWNTYAELAAELRLRPEEVKRALDRHRKREKPTG